MVVEEREAVLVEGGSEMSLSNSKSDSVGESWQRWRVSETNLMRWLRSNLTLSERSGGDLDSLGDSELGVTRGDRVELTEL